MPRDDYTVSEIAKIFGKTKQTMHNWIELGRFPNSYMKGEGGGKILLIPPSDVEKVRKEEADKLLAQLHRLGFQPNLA